MIITVSGRAGSGKSTLAKKLAERYGLKYYSVGDLFGEIALEKGMSLLELNKAAERDDSIDRAIDKKTEELGKREDNFVIDSRLAWHFIPHSIKIFLSVSLEEAAKRIFSTKRPDERENTSLQKTIENIKVREESEKKRYQQYYGLNYFDKKNYDIVVDTTNKSIKEVFEEVCKRIEEIIHK